MSGLNQPVSGQIRTTWSPSFSGLCKRQYNAAQTATNVPIGSV